jgi:hypothetical protein
MIDAFADFGYIYRTRQEKIMALRKWNMTLQGQHSQRAKSEVTSTDSHKYAEVSANKQEKTLTESS